MNGFFIQHCPTRNAGTVKWDSIKQIILREGYAAPMRYDPIDICMYADNSCIIGITKPCGSFCHSIQDGLNVSRVFRYDRKDFTGCGLLFQRLSNFPVACLNFVEEPCPLDRYSDIDRQRGKQTCI